MTDPTFTILLPVHRPPALLPYAIASVQAQKRQHFELFVICDGAPPETAALARSRAAADARIRVFEHPKGERNGEAYRHQALQEARGRYVCQIADDDLWLPEHLTEIEKLLRSVQFGNISMVWVQPNGKGVVDRHDLADPATRERMLKETWNFFGPTTVGYRLAAYRALPVGWTPAPPGIASDLFMWRKFLARTELSVSTRLAVTSAHFAAPYRADWSDEQRAAEIRDWAERFADPRFRRSFVRKVLSRGAGDAPKTWSSRLAGALRKIRPRFG
jgi:glycosyltransferase involved in cell wall biosynthesis